MGKTTTSNMICVLPSSSAPLESLGIKEVFECNLEEEMRKINRLIKKFPYVAIDTEFPGVVARPCGVFNTNIEYEYALFKVNVDLMKIIQLGLSFFNKDGQQPTPIHTWQFNFRFNLAEEMYAQESIKLLIHSGIQFALHESGGIEADHFAERLITSNILCNDRVRFLTFHSAYDFGYLLKVLEGNEHLPRTEKAFLDKLKSYFPHIYDIKHMIRDHHQRNLKGGLQDLANQFQLARVGAQHQAGSDSALTGALFFRLRDDVFKGQLEEFTGKLFGLTGSFGDRVQHLDNVVIKENVNRGASSVTSSPISSALTIPTTSTTTTASTSITTATTTTVVAAAGTNNTTASPLSVTHNHSNSTSEPSSTASENAENTEPKTNNSTFTLLPNVTVPDNHYTNAAFYSSGVTASGDRLISADPSSLLLTRNHHPHASMYSPGSTYYDSNGYAT